MSSDPIYVQQEVRPRVQSLGERVSRLETLRWQLREDLKSVQAEVEHLSNEVEVLTKVEQLFRALMDLLVVKQVKVIEEVVTEGLQTIFYDQNLHFEAELGLKYNKVSIEFFIRQGDRADPISIRGRPMDSFGGGPVSVASFILRVMALFRLKRFPLLMMDETLAAVSDEYVEDTGRFLQTVANNMNLPILLITHKHAYTDHSDRAYRGFPEEVSGTQPCLKLTAL